MLRNNADEKAKIYETISSMNKAFAGIVQLLHTLQKTGLFKSKSAKLFPSFTLELQAEFDQESLEELHQLELEDCGTATAKHGNAVKNRFRRATYDFLLQI
jgi:hypothetical protein